MGALTGTHGKKSVWAVSLAVLILLLAFGAARPASAAATPGDLDRSFDEDGRVFTGFGYDGSATDVGLQSSGKIVAAGRAIDTPGGGFEDFALARYNANGSLDAAFGSGGKATVGFGDTNFNPQAVALQPDGKIVIAGVTGHDFVLIRYNASGSLDTSFGTGGKAMTDFDLGHESLNDLAVQPDGKIVAVGSSYTSDWRNENFALARYNANGSLDTGFDGDGKLTMDTGSVEEGASNVIVQPDGKIIIAGHSYIGGDYNGYREVTLIRYNPNGSFDTSFDGDGRLGTAEIGQYAGDLLLLSDGKILVLGRGGDNQVNLARYKTDGAPDDAFGEGARFIPGCPAATRPWRSPSSPTKGSLPRAT